MKKVLIALNASTELYEFVVKVAENSNMTPILDDSINVRSSLLMHVEQYSPEIIVMSDKLMGDEKDESPRDRDAALLQIMKVLRQKQIRVIFLSLVHPHRKEGDGFLGELVHLGIYDIWYQRTIDPEKFSFHFLDENRLDYKDVDYLSDMSKGFNWTPFAPAPPDSNEEAEQQPGDVENQVLPKYEAAPAQTVGNEPKIVYKKEKVVVEKIVEKVVRINASVTIKPLVIIVGTLNATGGSGASTISHLLAAALAPIGPYTAVVEAFTQGRIPQMLEYLGQENLPMGKEGEPWISWMRQTKDTGSIHNHWEQYGIHWAPLDPACPEFEYSEEENLLFISNSRQHPFVIVDIGRGWRSRYAEHWMMQADAIVGVTDCSNSRLWSATPSVQYLMKKYGDRFSVCLNRYSDTYKEIKDYVYVYLQSMEENPARDQVQVPVSMRIPDMGTYFSDLEWNHQPIDDEHMINIAEEFLSQYIDEKVFIRKEGFGKRVTHSLKRMFRK
ncbi:hypothetical protein [Brevibacillus reuszeri]|uniref:hypothetical protein n=1 Tax=Brevibacillus reuszeri TaxID=54915 RepID=UPI000CCC86F4|nr:hypothetical protein [Brevibacillus reuszeri]